MEEPPPEFVNFGKSLIVPSVQKLAKEPITKIPPRYVHHHQESPIVPQETLLPTVPIIDVQRLCSESAMDSELEKLHLACKDWGFFQFDFIVSSRCRNIIEKLMGPVFCLAGARQADPFMMVEDASIKKLGAWTLCII